MTITRDFLLEIPGLTGPNGEPLRYFSGRTPEAAAPTSSPGSVNFTDIEAIEGVSSITASIEEIGGVAEVTPVEVVLATGGAMASTPNDPGFVLTRLGLREADWRAQITGSTYKVSDLTPLTVDTDPAPLSTPCWVQLGGETLLVTGTAGSQPDPDVADPYRLTVSARGAGDTQIQNHILKFRGAGKPTVTSPLVNWQGRRAILYRWDGRQYAQIMRGFISATPQIAGDGLSVSLGILPMMVRLDRELATDSSVEPFGLLDGWHNFEEDLIVEVGIVAKRGDAINGTLNAAIVPASTLISGSPVERTGLIHKGVFDISLPVNAPRHGRFTVAYTEEMSVTAYPANDRDLTVGAGLPTTVQPIASRVSNTPQGELLRSTVSAGMVRVPDDLATAITADWSPGTHLGTAGSWMDVAIRPDQSDLLVKWNTSQGPRYSFEVWLWGRRPYGELGQFLRPSGIKRVDATGAETHMAPLGERVYVGIDLRDPDDLAPLLGAWVRRFEIETDITEQYKIPIVGVASSWYRPGEDYLLVNDNPLIPSDGLALEIVHEDDEGEEVVSYAKVLSSTPSGTGYLLELDDVSRRGLPAIKNVEGRAEVVIEPARTTGGLDPGVIILQLLISGGDGSSVYDVLPVGAGLVEDEVDIASCLRLTPSVEGLWSLIIPKDTPLRDLLSGVLLDCGAALVLRTGGDGVQRVTAVSTSPEVATERRATWLEFASTPAVEAIDDVKTNYEIRVDFQRDGKARPVNVDDPAAATLLGRQETLTVDMRGKNLALPRSGSALNAVYPVAARLATLFGTPRRAYSASLAAEQLGALGVGDVAAITDPHVRGPYPVQRRFGVEDLQGRLSRVSVDWWGGTAEVRMINYGGRRGGWAPSFEVTGIVSATTVEVSLTTYGSAENPYTGDDQDDLTPFAEGQAVHAIVEIDSATTYSLLINTIDRVSSPARVTFTTAHPYSGTDLGWVQSRDWDNAAAGHKLYAFIADAAKTLGAGSDEGFEIA